MKKVEATIYEVNEALPPLFKEVICFIGGKPVIGKIINYVYDDTSTESGRPMNTKPVWEIENMQTKTPDGWMVIHKIDSFK